jgi:DNA-binding HxlR family transcriptional regulator
MSIEGINKKTLSIRLTEIERNGIIKRKIYINPVRAEYLVTKKGRVLSAVLIRWLVFHYHFVTMKCSKIKAKLIQRYRRKEPLLSVTADLI